MGRIEITNLGKAYKIYPARWSRLVEWISPFSKKRHTLKWVLHDINFQLNSGESIGIIGLNGAGKSTLLKLITGTTLPTSGSVKITGRLAALLELGMGFHGDFTGRQNLYMAGQLLGYTTDEITKLMPEIEAFAEIGEYIDSPVRIYSSGMQMRLAFSIATAKRPDILIIDEALSVGDSYFQHKSFDRIRKFKEHGTTLLIVSHDKQAIQSICNRAILLNQGTIAMDDKPEAVMDYYNALLSEKENKTVRLIDLGNKKQTISGTGEATVINIEILNQEKNTIEIVDVGEMITLSIRVRVHNNLSKLVLGYMIKDHLGQVIYGTNTDIKKVPLANLAQGQEIIYKFKFQCNLGPGNYSIATALVSSDTHLENNYEWRDLALVFNIINKNRSHFIGNCWLDPKIEITQL